MAVAPSVAVQCLSFTQTEGFNGGQSVPVTLPLQRKPLSFSLIFSSRARNRSSAIAASSSKKKKKKKTSHNHATEGNEDEEVDAFELLFKQLEEDLKKDDLSNNDGDDEITEEDLAIFERELEDALGDYDAEMLNSDLNDTEAGNDAKDGDDEDEDEDEEEDEKSPKLRNWQMKKLAKALKVGRRKTSIKNLAADLCLDRALVLELLRDPPPNLLMLSLSLPDEPTATVTPLETKPREIVHEKLSIDHEESGAKAKLPVHAMQHKWSAQKRLKKVQVATLERVYGRSKRPTNAMISSIVHVTNIPRKRVIKWFEDKRAEEGVPDQRVPYQRSVSEAA